MVDLDSALAAYLARPVTGDRLPATYAFDTGLVGLLQQLAAERGVPPQALAEWLIFRALKGEHARRLVGEKPEPVPASFVDDRVARAKIEVARDVAAVKAGIEDRGDKATRLAAQLEAVLQDASGGDTGSIDALRQAAREGEARVDLALDAARKKPKF